MKDTYSENQNLFVNKKVANFKQTLVYPNEGSVRFQIQTDKNGQVYEIRQSYAQIIKDEETKKRFVKIILGERPKLLYDMIKGRPLKLAMYWIDNFISSLED